MCKCQNIIIGILIMGLIGTVFSQQPVNTQLKQASAWLRTGRLVQGEKLLKKILKENPQERRAYHMLVDFYLRQNLGREAIKLIEEWSLHNKPDLSVSINMVEALYQVGKADSARRLIRGNILADTYLRAITLQNFLDLTRILQINHEDVILLDACEQGIRKFPRMSYFYQVKIAFFEKNGDYEKMIAEYMRLLQNNGDQFRYVSGRILSLPLPENKIEQVERILRDVYRKNDKNQQMLKLYVEWLIRYNHLDKAIKLSRLFKEEKDKIEYISLIGAEMAKKGKREAAGKILEQTYLQYEGHGNIVPALLEFYEEEFRHTARPELLEKIFSLLQSWKTKSRKKPELMMHYLKLFLKAKFDLDKALTIAEGLRNEYSNKEFKDRTAIFIGTLYRLKNDFIKSDSILKTIRATGKTQRLAEFELLKNYFYEAQTQKFSEYYKKKFVNRGVKDTLANNFLNLRFLVTLAAGDSAIFAQLGKAELLKEQGQLSESILYLENLYSELEGGVLAGIVAFNAAENNRILGRKQQAVRWFDEALKHFKASSQRVQLLFKKADLMLELGHMEEAKNIYFEILKITPMGKWARMSRNRLEKIKQEPVYEN